MLVRHGPLVREHDAGDAERRLRMRVSAGARGARRRRTGGDEPELLLTVLTGSSRVNTFTGEDLPGTYTCCTARSVGPVFRPRANATTTQRVNVRVFDVRSKAIQHRITPPTCWR